METTRLFLTLLAALAHGIPTSAYHPCSFTKYQDELRADCAHQQLTSLPLTWPGDIARLDFSNNNVSELTGLTHGQLVSLLHLDLSHNYLTDTLPNGSFSNLQHLQWLSLKGNRLQGLQANAMAGLKKLTFLDLSDNQLQLSPHTYPPGVFQPLASLQELRIDGNDKRQEGQYPENIFDHLSTLQTLNIDTFMTTQFSPDFSTMTSLKTLKMTKNCKLKYFINDTLQAFHNLSLEEIHIDAPSMVRLETCAFCHLPSLKKLHLNRAYIDVTSALSALYGLQHQDMDVLDFSGTHTLYSTTIDMHDMRYVRNICVKLLSFADTNIQRFRNNAAYVGHTTVARCLQEIDLSQNRLLGDVMAIFVSLLYLKNLTSFRMDAQKINSVHQAGCLLGQNSSCATKVGNYKLQSFDIPSAPKLRYLNISAGLRKMDKLPSRPNLTFVENLTTLDISYCLMSTCEMTFVGLKKLETFDLSGNYCHNISETIFDYCASLKNLRLSNFNVNPEFFRIRGWRLFQNLTLLETLDLSLNNLVHLDRRMLREQRLLKELNLAGNRLQTLSVDVGLHGDLQLLDVSHNMLPTLLPHERQALDALVQRQIIVGSESEVAVTDEKIEHAHNRGLQGRRKLRLRLSGNPLLCACSNLDFVQWLWTTSVELDGGGDKKRNYTCVTDTGEVSDTATVIANYDFHWRRCNGQYLLGASSAAFLLQLLALVIVYVVSRSWTHIRYVWKVMKRLRLPRRHHFRRDAYVGYADADWEVACLKLPKCLEECHGVRLLLRDREELPGSFRAESIVEHIDESWKVLLLVTRAFAEDEWASGFTVLQAQRSITDTMPDRVIVVLLDDPVRLPPMASLERLLRMVPESRVLRVSRNAPEDDTVWEKLAEMILTDGP